RHAEVLEIVKPVDDALEVTAVATELHGSVEVLARGGGPRFLAVPVLRPGCRHPVVGRRLGRHTHDIVRGGIVRRVAVSEALDEYLVPDRVLGPGGDGEVGPRRRRLPRRL